MDENRLQAKAPLGGRDRQIGRARLRERDELSLVSLAIPLGGEAELGDALKQAYGLDMPDPRRGRCKGDIWALRTGHDQMLLIFPHPTPDAGVHVNARLSTRAYVTDQTDGWVKLLLSGAAGLDALERLCPLDLELAAFPVGASARTVMEHLGVILLRLEQDRFLLLSARSSAESFWDAVAMSCEFVVD